MLKFQPFTRDDWYGYAGAERFPLDREPVICETPTGATVIADAQGCEIETDDGTWHSPNAGLAFALRETDGPKEWEALGFRKLGV